MAALKMGLTMKLWWGFRVLPYASRKESESSTEGFWTLCSRPCLVKSRPLELLANGMYVRGGLFVPDEPEAALGGSVLASLELVTDKVLDGRGLGGSSGVAST